MVIHLVCGARPNFMKVAPLYHALAKEPWASPVIVHTGQHYDANMSGSFFADLGMPEPSISLGVGSGSHAEQTAKVMVAYEKILRDQRPDLVVVVGDVNSTLAATLAASKLGVKVAHLEAGLRSFDRTMPEEINRLVTDVLADLLWVPSRDGIANLLAEGVPESKIAFVGNIMIDSLEMLRDRIERLNTYVEYGQTVRSYAVVTLHRPSNVDDPAVLGTICGLLEDISEMVPLIFPVHPRTRRQINEDGLFARTRGSARLVLPDPLNYISFMNLVLNARLVITDSGGIQEETSYLGIPCLTMRENTERPITLTHGTNQLCRLDALKAKVQDILRDGARRVPKIELWDGRTAQRIVAALRPEQSQAVGVAPAEDRVGVTARSSTQAVSGA
jgi:UDP-N-acetylglucosamine 2-epimerase (non-hydrolysing)